VKKSADDGGNLEKETKKFDKTRYKQYFLPKKKMLTCFQTSHWQFAQHLMNTFHINAPALGCWWNVQWFPKPAGRDIHIVVASLLYSAP